MAGKPSVPKSVLRKIAALYKKGMSATAIAEAVHVSNTTVRKVVQPGFAEQERARHAAASAARYAARKDDPAYQAYQAERNHSEAHRERVRKRMAELRAARKLASEPVAPEPR